MNKLSAVAVNKATKAGLYGDGGGLWLQVGPTGGKSWLLRFTLNGKAREMGLGALHTVSLAEARERARSGRLMLLDGIDPLEARKQARAQKRLQDSRRITFKRAVASYLKSHKAGWKNEKHAEQWESTLSTYAFPVFADRPVSEIDTPMIMKCLDPIWREKSETASRLRGRIENILDWATAHGYRQGENPARWRGHLDKLLPARSKVRKVEHHPALPYLKIPEFMTLLRAQDGAAARALEFTILTGCRTSEVLNARWDEIDTRRRLWIVPAERMKAGKEHRVPLSTSAMEIVKQMHQRGSIWIFEGRKDKPLSSMALLMTLRRMNRSDLTVHGFRSTLRDWAAETTTYPNEVAEMALAHTVGDKVEAAYRRGDLLEKRFEFMNDWARYCSHSPHEC